METGRRGGKSNRGEMVLSNKIVQRFAKGANFFDGSLFSLVSKRNFGEVSERRELLLATFFDEVVVKAEVIGSDGEVDDGRRGLIGLDENRGGVEVSAPDAPDNLS